MNLVDSTFGDIPPPKQKEEKDDTDDEDNFYPHWIDTIDVNLVCDFTKYSKKGGIPSEVAAALKVNW